MNPITEGGNSPKQPGRNPQSSRRFKEPYFYQDELAQEGIQYIVNHSEGKDPEKIMKKRKDAARKKLDQILSDDAGDHQRIKKKTSTEKSCTINKAVPILISLS